MPGRRYTRLAGAVSTDSYPRCVPLLTDGTVTLRAHRASDIPRIIQTCNDPEALRWTVVPRPYDEPEARAFLQFIEGSWTDASAGVADARWFWAITRADEDTFLGTMEVRPSGGGGAEVSFGLHADARGAGLLSRATRLAMAYAAQVGVGTLRWQAYAGNWSSRRVAWACGFSHEGTLRGSLPRLADDGSRARDVDGWSASWSAGEPMTPARPWYEPPVRRVAAADGVRVCLRPWREDDQPRLPSERDPESWHRLGAWVPTSANFLELWDCWREDMALGQRVVWCLADPTTDAPQGGLHLFGIDRVRRPGTAEILAFVLPGGRGRGLFAAALPAVLDHAFTATDHGGMGLARVKSLADVDNHGSVRSMLRGGMTLTGWTRGDRPDRRAGHEGDHVDMVQFEVLATDDRPAISRANAAAGHGIQALLADRAQHLGAKGARRVQVRRRGAAADSE